MVKTIGLSVVMLFVGLYAVEHFSQHQFVRPSSGVGDICVADCGNKVSDDTELYCSTGPAFGCLQDTSVVTLACDNHGIQKNFTLDTGCQSGNSQTACTQHAGAKLAIESGNYELVDGSPGSCGTWSGFNCKTTLSLFLDPCGHQPNPGHYSYIEQICAADPTQPIGPNNCPGVVKLAGAC